MDFFVSSQLRNDDIILFLVTVFLFSCLKADFKCQKLKLIAKIYEKNQNNKQKPNLSKKQTDLIENLRNLAL